MSMVSRKLRILAERKTKLQEQQARVEGAMAEEIADFMATHDIELASVRNALSERQELLRPTTGKRAKRPIRYRDAETGHTWAGVGVRPKWLRDKLEQGRTLEEFLVGN